MPATHFRDYYSIMGLPPTCSQDDIKRTYRTLARKHHPDVNKAPDAAKRFSDINEAYEVLGDPQKRKAYDDLRQGGWREGQEFTAPPRQEYGGYTRGAHEEQGFGQFSDFFESLFGAAHGGRSGHGAQRGEDLHHAISITLEEAYHGGQRQLQLHMPRTPGYAGPAVRTLEVAIPKGLVEGEQIRLRGQGMPGSAPGFAGDLYLDVSFAPHSRYQVDGRDLSSDLRLAPWEAVLGAKVMAPTLGGAATVTIAPGSLDGQRLRLKHQGLPGDPPGDHYLTLRIAVPAESGDEAKRLWRQLAALSPFDPRRESSA